MKTRLTPHLFFGLILTFSFFFSTSLNAQDNDTPVREFSTDRPDQTEAPNLVPHKYFQIETGGFYTESDVDNFVKIKTTVLNTTLLRYGLLDNFELRLGISWIEEKLEFNSPGPEPVFNGFTPLSLGFKIGITEEKGALPHMAFLGAVILPFTASDDFKPSTTGLDMRLAFAHTLSEKSSLSYNFGAVKPGDVNQIIYVYTLSYGLSLSNTIGMFAEVYGSLPEDSSADHLWDAGFTWRATPNLQFDLTGGTGLASSDQNFLVSAGLSVRFPN